MVKVLLVNPKGFDTSTVVPLSLGYLKSNSDADIDILDNSLLGLTSDSEEFHNKLSELKPDVVGVTCWSPTFIESINILKKVKKFNKNIITIIGGVHITTYPRSIMDKRFIDFGFMGESEKSFRLFLKEIDKVNPDFSNIPGLIYKKEGSIILNNMHKEENLDKIKFPDYDSIRLEDYIQRGYKLRANDIMNAPIWTTRGCPYNCGFCSAGILNGKIIRKHSVKYILKWVEYLYKRGIRHINIIDDNFTFDVKYAKSVCRGIIKLNYKDLYFGTPNGIRIQQSDIELFRLMKKAGWTDLIIAPESGSVKVLKRMRKNLDPSIIPDKVNEIRKAGLRVSGFFIIGYPDETIEDVKETVNLIRKCKFDFFFLNNFQPLPGTPIYDELVESGEIREGLLPENYSSGKRAYVPKDLKDFNFPRFILKEYFLLVIRRPLNIFNVLDIADYRIIIKKGFLNLRNMVFKEANK